MRRRRRRDTYLDLYPNCFSVVFLDVSDYVVDNEAIH